LIELSPAEPIEAARQIEFGLRLISVALQTLYGEDYGKELLASLGCR